MDRVTRSVFILFILTFGKLCNGLPFEMVETNREYIQKVIEDGYKNILFPTNHNVVSAYLQSLLKETWNIDNPSTYLNISNRELYLFVSSQKTNFPIKRLPVPFMEGIEVFIFLPSKDYLSRFKKFSIADFGETKVVGLWYNDNAYLLVYVSKNTVLRVDYWLSERSEDMMIWSYLCAYDERKVEKKFILSGMLLNLQAKEFYKFDFTEKK